MQCLRVSKKKSKKGIHPLEIKRYFWKFEKWTRSSKFCCWKLYYVKDSERLTHLGSISHEGLFGHIKSYFLWLFKLKSIVGRFCD